MCLKISNYDYDNYGWGDIFSERPVAGYLLHKTLEFRNVPSDAPPPARVARRLFAEIFFAAAALVAVAEGVMRVAFGILALIPSLICCGSTTFDNLVVFMTLSGALILELVLRCLLAFVGSPLTCGDMRMEDLELCPTNCGRPAGASIFGGE